MSELVRIITSADPAQRNRSLDSVCRAMDAAALLRECTALDHFRRSSDNLYERVRALFFLYAIYRFHLPRVLDERAPGLLPFEGYTHLLKRRFEEAIDLFLQAQAQQGGPTDAIASALASAYHALGFQTLADQVRRNPVLRLRAIDGAVCARCAATSGCFASAILPITRCVCAASFMRQKCASTISFPSCTNLLLSGLI